MVPRVLLESWMEKYALESNGRIFKVLTRGEYLARLGGAKIMGGLYDLLIFFAHDVWVAAANHRPDKLNPYRT
jgi:hypothetical protein